MHVEEARPKHTAASGQWLRLRDEGLRAFGCGYAQCHDEPAHACCLDTSRRRQYRSRGKACADAHACTPGLDAGACGGLALAWGNAVTVWEVHCSHRADAGCGAFQGSGLIRGLHVGSTVTICRFLCCAIKFLPQVHTIQLEKER